MKIDCKRLLTYWVIFFLGMWSTTIKITITIKEINTLGVDRIITITRTKTMKSLVHLNTTTNKPHLTYRHNTHNYHHTVTYTTTIQNYSKYSHYKA